MENEDVASRMVAHQMELMSMLHGIRNSQEEHAKDISLLGQHLSHMRDTVTSTAAMAWQTQVAIQSNSRRIETLAEDLSALSARVAMLENGR